MLGEPRQSVDKSEIVVAIDWADLFDSLHCFGGAAADAPTVNLFCVWALPPDVLGNCGPAALLKRLMS